jgi:hypothetical protein
VSIGPTEFFSVFVVSFFAVVRESAQVTQVLSLHFFFASKAKNSAAFLSLSITFSLLHDAPRQPARAPGSLG